MAKSEFLFYELGFLENRCGRQCNKYTAFCAMFRLQMIQDINIRGIKRDDWLNAVILVGKSVNYLLVLYLEIKKWLKS